MKTCPECGKTFAPLINSQECCSTACMDAYLRDSKPDRDQAVLTAEAIFAEILLAIKDDERVTIRTKSGDVFYLARIGDLLGCAVVLLEHQSRRDPMTRTALRISEIESLSMRHVDASQEDK